MKNKIDSIGHTQTEDIVKEALNCGFDCAALINTSEIEFDATYRKYCEDNLCGYYGKNYACPPDCGTPEQMKQKARLYKQAVVLQKISHVEDRSNTDQLYEARTKVHTVMRKFIGKLAQNGIKGIASMPGGCNLCKACKKMMNEPCIAPESIASCLSAYCIKTKELAEKCGMTYFLPDGEISFFCMYFIAG